MNLSARQLRAFVALCDERHFTRAAQRCHLTQPAFSALIRSLEQDAGARLFDRNTRRVDLTPEGRVLEAWARRLLADNAISINGEKTRNERFEEYDFRDGLLLLRKGKAFKDSALVERA